MAHQHSQSSGSSASTLIDATIEAFDQGQAASPQEGLSLITDWFSSLKSTTETADLIEPLNLLRDELQGGTPNNAKLKSILEDLADRTEQLADSAGGDFTSRLTTLAQALRNFSSQLSTAV
jgi:hypothetical protein